MRKKSILRLESDADAHADAASDALDRGDFLNALYHINEARRIEPFTTDFRMLAADAYFEMGLFERALETDMGVLAMTVLHEKPSFDIVYGCVRSLMAMGESEAAIRYLTFAYSECPDFNAETLSIYGPELQALIASASGHNGFRLVDESREDEDKLRGARHLIRLGKDEEAAGVLVTVPRESGRYLSAAVLRAECLLRAEGREKDALRIATSLAEEYPDSVAAVAAAARVCFAVGRKKQAEEYRNAVRKYRGQDPEALGRAALACAEGGFYDDARECLDLCLRHYPYDTDLLTAYAMVQSKLGRFSEAEDTLLAVLAIDPSDSIAMYHNARLHDGTEMPLDPFSLPKKEILARLDLVAELASMDKTKFLDEAAKSYHVAVVKWVLLNEYLPERDDFDILFALCDAPQFEFLFRELAASRNTPVAVRKLITAVMVYSWSSDLCVCVGEDIRRLDCRMPAKGHDRPFYLKAWAYTLAALSDCGLEFEKPLRSFFAKIIQTDLVPDCTEKQLAAVMVTVFATRFGESFGPDTDRLLDGLCDDLEEIQHAMKEVLPILFRAGIIEQKEDP